MPRVLRIRTKVLPGGRIEIVDRRLAAGETVDVVVSRAPAPEGRSVADILEEAPGHRLFGAAKQVDDYIREERASWDG